MVGGRSLARAPATTLERALVHRLSLLHDNDALDIDAIDREASFFTPTGFYLGEHVLDSLDIVELIVSVEVDFGVSLVEAHDIARFDSIAKLSALLERVAEPAVRTAFESQWGP